MSLNMASQIGFLAPFSNPQAVSESGGMPERSQGPTPGSQPDAIINDSQTNTLGSVPPGRPQDITRRSQTATRNSRGDPSDLEKGADHPVGQQPKYPDDKEYEYFVKMFNFRIALSTFVCTLIIAYLSYANNLAKDTGHIKFARGIPYNCFKFLAFVAIACHAGCSIMASRCAVLCSDPKINEKKRRTTDDFKTILNQCERIGLFGTVLFALAAFGLVFYIFDNIIYPSVLLGLTFAALVVIFAGKYGRFSRLYDEVEDVMNSLRPTTLGLSNGMAKLPGRIQGLLRNIRNRK